MTYEKLIVEGENEDILIVEMKFKGTSKGLYSDKVIAIDSKIETTIEKKCILIEELGHYHTTSGNILDQENVLNKKQERRARGWGYERLVNLLDIINAFKYGTRNRYELAEYLDITEEFLEEAINYYKEKYEGYCQIGNYVVYFNPLSVLEVWE